MYLHEHADDCRRILGRKWIEVHRWLDAYARGDLDNHRRHRHHAEGIEEARKMWGDEGARAAKIHVIADCWGIPAAADYQSGRVNHFGFFPESKPGDADILLEEIRSEKMQEVHGILQVSFLVSRLPESERQLFLKFLMGRGHPSPLPGDPQGDTRVWSRDYDEFCRCGKTGEAEWLE